MTHSSTHIGVATPIILPTRDPTAVCTVCRGHGTVAYAAWEEKPIRVERFCRRCWPATQERLHRERRAAFVESFNAMRAWEERRLATGDDSSPPEPVVQATM